LHHKGILNSDVFIITKECQKGYNLQVVCPETRAIQSMRKEIRRQRNKLFWTLFYTLRNEFLKVLFEKGAV
jgi:hypothetical protein